MGSIKRTPKTKNFFTAARVTFRSTKIEKAPQFAGLLSIYLTKIRNCI